jgi:hypothetical protein
MKEKYKVNGSLAKCDLIGVVSDAEHVGENIPFCPKGNKKEDEDNNDNKGKIKTKVTYPPVKIKRIFLINFYFINYYLSRKVLLGEEILLGKFLVL